ncbi:sugar phosphate isomerase/epimerase [Candidatus Woesearchaeota archaeon]|nr:sugar phosphate isomerase/epimerase [Candidatus Woesearchaeota archaeon]
MLWAGQNKHWGNIEEGTQFWLELGINHVMVKDYQDTPLITREGELQLDTFEKLRKLQEKYKVKYHFHPCNLVAKKTYLTPAIKEAQPILKGFLKDLDTIISDHGFYPLITLHLPFITHQRYKIDIDEKSALELSVDFYQDLDLKSRLALETMHDPYKNKKKPNNNLLGYKPEHFTKIIGEKNTQKKNIGLCIDTGHHNMTETPTQDFLELPYPIYSVHLNGNNWEEDEHALPNYLSVRDFKATIKAIKKCEGPIVLEIKRNNYSKNQIKECLDYWKNLASYEA